MPYCAETFAIVKNTDKYKLQMCALNKKSYNKMKTERLDEYMNKLVLKQAKYLIKNKNPGDIEKSLDSILSKQGIERHSAVCKKLIELGYNLTTQSVQTN